jgi:hypothetical protein
MQSPAHPPFSLFLLMFTRRMVQLGCTSNAARASSPVDVSTSWTVVGDAMAFRRDSAPYSSFWVI